MTEPNAIETRGPAKWRKQAVQAVIGAIAGGSGMVLAMEVMGSDRSAPWDSSQVIVVGIGVIYMIMALFVGIGVAAPRAIGARLLNVSDDEEIREERSKLLASAFGCMVIGASLALIGYAATGAAWVPVSAATAYWLFVLGLIVTTAVSIPMWRNFDELWRRVTGEAAALFGYLMFGVCALWGGAAASGLATGPNALDLLSLAFGGYLLATFIVIFRRGMATQP